MEPRAHPVRLRARYAETDQMGIVHHAVYPVWFEAARTELARALGTPYTEWEAQGIYLMLSDLSCRYRRAARYDEQITVWAWVVEAASRRVVFGYRVEGPDGAVLAEGTTRHLVVDRRTGRPTVLPEPLRASLDRSPAPGIGP
jgi:acyl-CoA thioester hydrolase